MAELVGLIPSAGKGTRAYPYTRNIPKGMLKVTGIPILEYTMSLLRDQLNIRRIFIVINELGQAIRQHFGDGEHFGVHIEYIKNKAVHLGLAYSVFLARDYIQDPFILMLSDEYYQDTNHAHLLTESLNGALGICGLFRTEDEESIRWNYTVALEEGHISRLIEKPQKIDKDFLGTGTMLLSPAVFKILESAFARPGGPPDFIGLLDRAVQEGHCLRPFFLEGQYVNINYVDNLNRANFLSKSKRLPGASLSVVVQAFGNEKGLSRLVAEFNRLPRVNEVLVTVPGGLKKPAWIQDLNKTQWLPCPPGIVEYGSMIAFGLEQARGELITLVEGSYSFYPTDIYKLLSYIADADLVLGTRTTRQLVQQGTRMRGLVRLAHIFLAKLIELLWIGHRVRLTDVGCTYRTLWRHCYLEIKDRLRSTGPEYVLEMTIETLRSRQRLIEVPVSFLRTNEVLAERYQHFGVFLRMIRTIIRYRLGMV
jgi:UDP-N-acetylglucosamine diphosphorylase / glucose-1-phosphate thymidylyltransferase / UDP-N-acetylgalactosamine diphosphorylase / glucosamine-1-phosphate N-acetyltransferase / galactosamine-1-phosphate N-acetyltransferase